MNTQEVVKRVLTTMQREFSHCWTVVIKMYQAQPHTHTALCYPPPHQPHTHTHTHTLPPVMRPPPHLYSHKVMYINFESAAVATMLPLTKTALTCQSLGTVTTTLKMCLSMLYTLLINTSTAQGRFTFLGSGQLEMSTHVFQDAQPCSYTNMLISKKDKATKCYSNSELENLMYSVSYILRSTQKKESSQ